MEEQRFTVWPGLSAVLGGAWWLLAAQGVALILLGVMILLVPELLIAMVAGAFMLVGLIVLVLAWRLRRLYRRGLRGVQLRRDTWGP